MSISDPGARPVRGAALRRLYVCGGWLCVGLGIAGIALPVLPGVPFLIVALWAFSRGSERFHTWLYTHPRYGPPLQRWHRYRVIPPGAKAMALPMMLASAVYVAGFSAAPLAVKIAVVAILALAFAYVASRPNRPPQPAPEPGDAR